MRVRLALLPAAVAAVVALGGCSKPANVRASDAGIEGPAASVGVTRVIRKPMSRELTVSSELVPFQEIDVYAKESGYVKELYVDYGTRVKKNQVMAVLEIPELQALLQQDEAAIRNASDQVTRAEHELSRAQAQYKDAHLQYTRLKGVSDARPGLVAQQEVDDSQYKDLGAQEQVDASSAALQAAKSQLAVAQAKKEHDEVLYSYSKITAPFEGVVTQRYANYGTLMQAGTGSSTQALPLVKLSQDDLFRLVIPVPESYVKYIKEGDNVRVRVPSIDKVFPGKVKRFSLDVTADTRTMHTEVDVANPAHVLMPGLYAEATLTLEHRNDALVVPIQAISQTGDEATVFIVDANDRLQSRKIQVGLETSNDAEVLSGLNEGDRVVVSDRSGLKPGTEVQPKMVEVLQYQGEGNQ